MEDTQVSGPDLAAGVPANSLADGGMIAGHVGEEAVLLVRKGDEFFAVSAFCTHYRGPLAEGAIVGETLRCPWHHACFDLRTGGAVAAPALRPLEIFKTEREGDLVRVGSKGQPKATVRRTSQVRRIAIIGAGAAGSFAASELRRIGYDGSVTLLTREERLPYDKPNLSKDYLAGRAPEEWIPLRSADEYTSDGVELRLKTSVESIDTTRHELHLAGGESLSFDRLIIATGASPRQLEVAAQPSARIHYLRTWADAAELRSAADGARKVVIIGASFIGLETAASLCERNIAVTVVGREERPLENVLGSAVGDFVRRTHEAHGVHFRLGRRPVEIRPNAVVLDDGSAEAADLVIAGVGVMPETDLAARAGLKLDRGIVVDDYLQTSATDVFAAGDAARFPSVRNGAPIRVEHWVAAGRQGQVAARNAIGLRERFTAVPFFWSQHYDLVLAYVGHATRADDVEICGSLEAHNCAAVYREGGRITAVATLFRDDVSLQAEAAMERNDPDEAILAMIRGAFA